MLRCKGGTKLFIRKTVRGIILVKGKNDTYDPPTGQSSRWKKWMTEQDPKVCSDCESMQGKIYSLYEDVDPAPPLHPNCRCQIEVMKSVIAGFATKDGINGADWWLKHNGKLPDYYITLDELYALGYGWGKVPRKFAPGKMITRGIYYNDNGHLPDTPGRIWYEADINYYEGKRNKHRIYWSNDGLIFVSYNHGETFYEVI